MYQTTRATTMTAAAMATMATVEAATITREVLAGSVWLQTTPARRECGLEVSFRAKTRLRGCAAARAERTADQDLVGLADVGQRAVDADVVVRDAETAQVVRPHRPRAASPVSVRLGFAGKSRLRPLFRLG
jgi:hypothetical protein